MVGAGMAYSGAVADDVVCWPDSVYFPDLVNPHYHSVGDLFACALDDTGVACWDGSGERDVPPALKN